MAYFAVITTLGLAKLAEAQAAGARLVLSEIAVGDGNGAAADPSVAQTELVNEVWRGAVNAVDLSPSNPRQLRIEGLIPVASGGWTIREVGVFSAAGDLIAVASYPPTYKPTPAEGVSLQEYIRVLIEYAQPETVEITVDTSVVIATREYVDEASIGSKLYLWENFT